MVFKIDPVRELYYAQERIMNTDLRRAENYNATKKFQDTILDKIDKKRPRNINIICFGWPRDGKSYTMISLGHWIQKQVYKKNGKEVNVRVFSSESEFLDALPHMGQQDISIIDEKETATVQDGSWVEEAQMTDFDNICAAKCLIVIRLKPQQIYNSTANIILKTHSNDTDNFRNKMLLKVKEHENERWVGYVIIPLSVTICEDRKAGLVGSCYFCPKWQPDEKQKKLYSIPQSSQAPYVYNPKDALHTLYNYAGVKYVYPYCEHFIADYERQKMENIDRLVEGKAESRAEMRDRLAHAVAQNKEFQQLSNAASRKNWIELHAGNKDVLGEDATNRRLTTSEIEKVEGVARDLMKAAKRAEQEEGLYL